MSKTISIFFFTLAFFLIVAFIGVVGYNYVVTYQYERQLGSYMETATDTITPESFREQLVLFKEAISKTGLSENDYGAMWFKKPDNSMKFQMQHIDSIIGRADAMIQWKNTVYNNGSQTVPTGQISAEAFRDVYNDKMNNLRDYIHAEGYRSDWIARDAWYVKYHPVLYFLGLISFILIVLIAIFIIIGFGFWNSYSTRRLFE